MKTNIFIVDDHILVSNAIADLINTFDNFTVSNQFKNGKELLIFLEKNTEKPAIILLDINMSVMNGFETMHHLHSNYPDIKVLALSMNDDDESIIKMMREGANGYISKIVKEDELIYALQKIVECGFYYTDHVTNIVFSNMQKSKKSNLTIMTEKEKEMLNYFSTDLTYKEIADKMFVSPKTVDYYRDALFQKFDVKSRIGLVMYAIKNHLIELL